MTVAGKINTLHFGILLFLLACFFILPAYHVGALSRIMVLAIYAIGLNILFGYTGLLSLGHAMFFAAGMYGLGLSIKFLGVSVIPAFGIGILSAAVLSVLVGLLALRTVGVSFMIVTLMFAQTIYLVVLYFGEYTRGDEGFVLQQAERMLLNFDVTTEAGRYFVAFGAFSICLISFAALVQSSFGKRLVAIRENEERARMLGYDVWRYKLLAVIISGTVSGVAGALYALLFGYVGATFASVQYSILPLLWVLLGGAGKTIGPLIGVAFMFYLIDASSAYTSAYMLIAGLALVILTMFAPRGIAGILQAKVWPWLP
ncbi:branched-chain amino acid ABC transporter permease [Parasulfitobacter algicola]|uniref:Branched-chain amino acid ABC transporter permease n=1 Tax=Parasulfitobacter algicola TaxID=2614809 RepID=A0ABX2IT45_9RHOB|nr:branched-chain amino acid ABC transporter permease [Sulfitobacter algicola]NSX56074.1 branched-chain amino acid ABC transporter permease [Sulfitobacter algicola]